MYPSLKRLGRQTALLGLALGLPLTAAFAQQRAIPSAWHDEPAARLAAGASDYHSWLFHYRPVTVDLATLRPVLAAAPMEGSAAARGANATVLALPLPDGSIGRFRIVEAPVMAPELAARYPEIKSYAGVGLDDPSASIRCDLTPLGFHAQILSRQMGTIYIDPVSLADVTHYVSFFKRDMNYAARAQREACGVRAEDMQQASLIPNQRSGASNADPVTGTTANRVTATAGAVLRTYRLCVAATQEYVRARGGTKVSAMASINTSVNRVVGVYEKELAVRMILVANNDQVVYVSGDPYTNNDGFAMLSQNQTTLTNIIGAANYDIGHVFSTGGGGVASYASVCVPSRKAQGVTGSPSPTGDAFDIDYVAHEMGHQFSGSHPFNGTSGSCSGGNRNASTAWEPGSGSTIMAYAGICDGSGAANSQDLQMHSDAYFHGGNFATEMMPFIQSTACAVQAQTGNTPPTVTIPANGKTIPKSTPFRLTAQGADADADALSYCWEEMDLGTAGAPAINCTVTQSNNQSIPLTRSYDPVAIPTRFFPKLSDLVNNRCAKGDALPSVNRNMKFRCVVRDEHVSSALGFVVGGVANSTDLTFAVSSAAGPFVVTSQNTAGGLWTAGTQETVTWNVANTSQAPVNCQTVDLYLSRDGGLTFTDTLATALPNSGSATFTIPASITPANNCRVMVAAADNFFFNINGSNFAVQAPQSPTFVLAATPATATVCPGTAASFSLRVTSLAGFVDPVNLTLAGLPTDVTSNFPTTPVSTFPSTVAFDVTALATATPGSYPLTITANGGTITQTTAITLVVAAPVAAVPSLTAPADGAAAQSTAPVFTWSAVANAATYTLEIATDSLFTNIVVTQSGLTTTTYTPTTGLTPNARFFWRVRAANDCGTGSNATAFSFRTAATTVITGPGQSPITIPSNAASTLNATITVNSCDLVADVNVKNLRVTYPNTGDLDLKLIGPGGTPTVFLALAPCPGSANLNLTFDEQAATGTLVCPANTGATYKPLGLLSRFNGRSANGVWTLQVTDNTSVRGGSIASWQLEVTTLATMPVAPTALALVGTTDHSAKLKWRDNACNEQNQIVERAPQGSTTFVQVGTAAVNDTTFNDTTVQPATSYCYRVRAENGAFQTAYTNEVCITTSPLGLSSDLALDAALTVAPNPSAGEFTLALANAPAGAVRVTVIDALGRAVLTTALRADASGQLRHNLDLTSQAEGVYALRLTLPDGRTAVRRLVKM